MIHESRAGAFAPPRCRFISIWAVALAALLWASPGVHADDRASLAGAESGRRPSATNSGGREDVRPNQAAAIEPDGGPSLPELDRQAVARTLQTVALFGLVSLAPVALLMLTGFVRISIVLTLLRQALGSPQVPGNQVITALSLLLTALVMWPWGERVYREAISP
jgi:flagellar biosynthetic protein FliP